MNKPTYNLPQLSLLQQLHGPLVNEFWWSFHLVNTRGLGYAEVVFYKSVPLLPTWEFGPGFLTCQLGIHDIVAISAGSKGVSGGEINAFSASIANLDFTKSANFPGQTTSASVANSVATLNSLAIYLDPSVAPPYLPSTEYAELLGNTNQGQMNWSWAATAASAGTAWALKNAWSHIGPIPSSLLWPAANPPDEYSL